MYEAFDPVLKPYEDTVVHDIHNLAADSVADRVAMFDIFPRAGRLLLETQRYLLVVFVDTDNHALYLLIEVDHLGRMRYSAPAQVGDVQQTVEAAKVNEYPEVRNILDHTLTQLTDFDLIEYLLLAGLALFLNEFTPGYNNIAPLFIDLEHFTLYFLADESAYIARLADVNL